MTAPPEDTKEFRNIASADGSLQLEFCARAGGSITGFRYLSGYKSFDLFRRWGSADTVQNGPVMASFPLTPYSNRIIDHKLTVGGTTYDVGPSFAEGNQLHGDGWVLPWKGTDIGQHHAVLELITEKRAETPYVYHARQTLRLENTRLEIAMEVTNRSGLRLPFGLGHHPFIPKNDQTILRARLPHVWLTKEHMVPSERIETPAKWDFSKGLTLADGTFAPASQGLSGQDLLDNCFQGWDQKTDIIWPDRQLRMTMTAEPVFRNFVIYLGPASGCFCAEPVTNIIDAFNLHERGVADTGTVFLEDGETLRGKMWFEVGPA